MAEIGIILDDIWDYEEAIFDKIWHIDDEVDDETVINLMWIEDEDEVAETKMVLSHLSVEVDDEVVEVDEVGDANDEIELIECLSYNIQQPVDIT